MFNGPIIPIEYLVFWCQFLKEYNYVNILMLEKVRVIVPFSPPNRGFSAKPQSLPKRG